MMLVRVAEAIWPELKLFLTWRHVLKLRPDLRSKVARIVRDYTHGGPATGSRVDEACVQLKALME